MNDSFQSLGLVHQVANIALILVRALKFGVQPQGVFQGAGLEGHHPGNAVDVAVPHSQGAPHVSKGRLGAQSAECDDLGHPVVAVTVDYVVQHLVPAVVLKVQVDVGHLLAFHVEEAFEHQLVLQRVYVGDAQAIQRDAGGGAAPHAVEDIVAADEVDDVPHDEEVVGEPGVLDDLKLVTQPLFGFLIGVGVPAAEPLFAQLGQVLVGVHSARR